MTFLSRFDFISMLMLPSFWIGLATVVIVTLVVYWLFTYLLNMVLKGARNWSEKQEGVGRLQHVVVDMLRRTSKFLLFVAALLFSLRFVDLPDRLFNTLGHAWFLVLAIQIALWLDQGVVSWMRHLMFSPNTSKNPVTMVIAGLLLRMMLWTMMLLSILANVGVNITALVASLGVGGIAIALAVQTILSDVFASLSIGFDKPFEIGDFVVFGDVAGTIEHIGLKTTRIRSLSGEQIVCGNAILLQQTLHNYKRMQTRRIVFTFGLALTTPPEKLRKVGEMVRSIITDVGNTRFDRAHFLGFGTDRLNFEVVHIVNSADYNTYMDIQQEINIRIMEHLAAEDIELAQPCVVVKGGVAVETPPAEPQGEQTAV